MWREVVVSCLRHYGYPSVNLEGRTVGVRTGPLPNASQKRYSLSQVALSPVLNRRPVGMGVCTPLIPRFGAGLTGPRNGILVGREQILPLWL
jgi:hypothetical protein